MSTCVALWAYRYINFLKIRQKVRFATSTFNFKNKSRISNTFPQAKMIVDVLQGAIFKISLHSTKISRSLLVKNLKNIRNINCLYGTRCRHLTDSTCRHWHVAFRPQITHVDMCQCRHVNACRHWHLSCQALQTVSRLTQKVQQCLLPPDPVTD